MSGGAFDLRGICGDVTALMRRFYGKGPARCRGYVDDPYLFLTLEGGLTELEETLLRKGDARAVRDIRTRFEELTKDEMVSIVERHTGVRVIDYMSQILTTAAVDVKIFVLDTSGDAGPGSADVVS